MRGNTDTIMKKDDIIARLKEAGVEAPEGAKVDELKALAAEAGVDLSEASKLVTVKVGSRPLAEGGNYYASGESFECEADRARALGDLVEVVG